MFVGKFKQWCRLGSWKTDVEKILTFPQNFKKGIIGAVVIVENNQEKVFKVSLVTKKKSIYGRHLENFRELGHLNSLADPASRPIEFLVSHLSSFS